MSKKRNKPGKKQAYKFGDLFGLAKANFDSNKFEKADGYFEQSLEKAMSANDEQGVALSYFGWIMSLVNQDRTLEALRLIKDARGILGEYLDSYFLEVLVCQRRGNHDEILIAAENYLEKLREIDLQVKPYLSSSSANLADILWMASESAWKKAEFRRALEFQRESLEAIPDNHFRRIVYATNLGHEGHIEEAIATLDEGIRNYPRETAFENAKALIYGEAEKHQDAAKVLEGLLRKNPRDVDALVNFGVISEKRGDYAESERYFKKALAIEPRHEVALSNLKHLADSIVPGTQKISLCMIVKNEEKFLPGCLASVKGLVDELIVVDTGSTDRTMDIAREYGAKIYEHPWQNDFSLHRNQSIEYATGDWILILDADEELDPSEHGLIRNAISRKNIDAVTFVVYNKIQGGRTGFLNSHRMFRSGQGYHYSGIVHNQLMMDGISLSSQFKVFHHGYGLSDEQMRAKGKRTEALLMKQLEENPDNAFAHFNLAQIYRGLGEPQKSLDHATRVIELLDENDIERRHVYVMALDQIGCAHVGLEQLDKSKEAFYKALEIKDDYLDPLFNLGYVYSREGNFDKADEIFHRYLHMRERFSEHKEWIGLILNNLNSKFAVHFGLGIGSFFRHDIDQALEYFRKVVDEVGDFEYTHHLMARCYRQKGDPDKILEHCRLAIEYGHEDAEIHLLMGEAYLNTKDALNAARCFHLSLELDREYFPSQLGLVSAATLDGDFTRALELIDLVLANSPKSPQALAARGDLLYHTGNFGPAAADYRNQANLNPEDPICWNNLGNCFLKQSNFASAEECYRQALRIAGDFSLAYRNMGVTLLKQGKGDDALSYFERYMEGGRDDSDVRIVLGDLLYERKDYWGAIGHFEKYLKAKPTDTDALLRLSDSYFNLGKLGAAIMGYEALVRLDPENGVANSRLNNLKRFEGVVPA